MLPVFRKLPLHQIRQVVEIQTLGMNLVDKIGQRGGQQNCLLRRYRFVFSLATFQDKLRKKHLPSQIVYRRRNTGKGLGTEHPIEMAPGGVGLETSRQKRFGPHLGAATMVAMAA